jgi:signal transduction histidine kinase
MSARPYIIAAVLIFLAGCAGLFVLSRNIPAASLDAVGVHESVATVETDWSDVSSADYVLPAPSSGHIDYVVIDPDGRRLNATRPDILADRDTAALHRDTVIDVFGADGSPLGAVIFYNDSEDRWLRYRSNMLAGCAAVMAAYCLLGILFVVQIRRRILKPFRTLKNFAASVAAGNLDIPLRMDRGNAFGAFTESFDLMRTELAGARENEQRANKSKKELVAGLSHDIKTPVASIKAIAELMAASAPDEKSQSQSKTIIEKADQIDLLISNLFNATLEELHELKVAPEELPSSELRNLAKRADYLNLANIGDIPECLVVADPLRLLQVFDNIFSNSYKYANTAIDVSAGLDDGELFLEFTDRGEGVLPEEAPLLTQKYFRGQNAADKSGSGIGLYIASYLMQRMNGSIMCLSVNGHSFTVKITLALA